MDKVFVCSPLVGNVPEDASEHVIEQAMKNNQDWAEMYCWYVTMHGHRPFAPHLFYTRFLNDRDPKARELGIQMGLEDLKECVELWIFLHEGDTPSRGMKREIELAEKQRITIRYIPSDLVKAAYAAAFDSAA